jgi:hypothetical protein
MHAANPEPVPTIVVRVSSVLFPFEVRFLVFVQRIQLPYLFSVNVNLKQNVVKYTSFKNVTIFPVALQKALINQ